MKKLLKLHDSTISEGFWRFSLHSHMLWNFEVVITAIQLRGGQFIDLCLRGIAILGLYDMASIEKTVNILINGRFCRKTLEPCLPLRRSRFMSSDQKYITEKV